MYQVDQSINLGITRLPDSLAIIAVFSQQRNSHRLWLALYVHPSTYNYKVISGHTIIPTSSHSSHRGAFLKFEPFSLNQKVTLFREKKKMVRKIISYLSRHSYFAYFRDSLREGRSKVQVAGQVSINSLLIQCVLLGFFCIVWKRYCSPQYMST